MTLYDLLADAPELAMLYLAGLLFAAAWVYWSLRKLHFTAMQIIAKIENQRSGSSDALLPPRSATRDIVWFLVVTGVWAIITGGVFWLVTP